jgi:hypothetical protein
MNSWYRDALAFFKRYFLIVLAAVVVGNILAWKNQKKKENFFESVIKVRARMDYYDLVRTRLEKIAGEIVKANPKVKSVPIESYRNENFYFLEMKLRFADTSGAAAIVNDAISRIKADEEFQEKYFNLLSNYDRLMAECQEMIRSNIADTATRDLAFKKILFDLKLYVNAQARYKIDLEEKIQIYFPDAHEFTFVESAPSSRTYLSATVLFFIIGLFLAVVIDRFRA